MTFWQANPVPECSKKFNKRFLGLICEKMDPKIFKNKTPNFNKIN